MSTAKLTGRENLTKYQYAFCFGPVGPYSQGKLNKMYRSTVLGTLPVRNRKDPDSYQQSDADPYQIEKPDPDRYQSENQDPESVSKGSGSAALP